MPALRARLGRVVRRLRKARGLSIEALADAVGLHRNYVGRLERGLETVAVDALERLTAALGVTLGAFFAEVDAEPAPPGDPATGGPAVGNSPRGGAA